MPIIELTTSIAAPIERVFDLSRSIDLHIDTMADSGERAIAGVTSGLIGLNEEVTWSGKHFGIRQMLSARIVAFDRPTYFADAMIRGAFREMIHHHYFEASGPNTLMRDVFHFESPLGILGRTANRLFLTKYMHNLLSQRNALIRDVAQSDRWKKYLSVQA